MADTPNPGSDEALDLGCRCPVIDNGHGKFPPYPPPEPCELWEGAKTDDGYGYREVVYDDGRRHKLLMHRDVVRQAGVDQFGTPWDESLKVLHLCDMPPCQRYSHLALGTQLDNIADMKAKGRGNGPRWRRNETNPAAKLTFHLVGQIRERLAAGLPQRAIAAEFDIAQSTVSRINTASDKGGWWISGDCPVHVPAEAQT